MIVHAIVDAIVIGDDPVIVAVHVNGTAPVIVVEIVNVDVDVIVDVDGRDQ